MRRPNETPTEFKRRQFCDRECFFADRNAFRVYRKDIGEPRPCGNPSCTNLIRQGAKEGRKKFERRKNCSKACADEVKRSEAARAHLSKVMNARVREKRQNGWQKEAVRRFHHAAPRNTGISDVAEFIAKHGITRLPTAYADVSTGKISDADRKFHAERYAEIERQRLANVKRRGVSA